jgi:hypothetical protein
LRPCTVALEAVEVLSADGYERRVVPAAHLAFGGALQSCGAMRCSLRHSPHLTASSYLESMTWPVTIGGYGALHGL